jgi:hypothetical protein
MCSIPDARNPEIRRLKSCWPQSFVSSVCTLHAQSITLGNATATVDGARSGCKVVHTSPLERPSSQDITTMKPMTRCTTDGRARAMAHLHMPTYWMRTHWPAPKLSFFVKKNRITWLPRRRTLHSDKINANRYVKMYSSDACGPAVPQMELSRQADAKDNALAD